MTRDQVLQIPVLVATLSIDEIAEKFSVTAGTVNYWIKRLRDEGIEVPTRRGRRPIALLQ